MNTTRTDIAIKSDPRYSMAMERTPLLLHCCCGPCSTSSIERLRSMGFEPVLFFGNSNIFPESEANQRYEALQEVADHFTLKLIHHTYDHASWLTQIHGHEADPEQGERCRLCFDYNLREAAMEAHKQHIQYFSTTLTVSPHKQSPVIFSVGQQWEEFVAIDFKKKDGYKRSVALAKELDLYRQDYCGCEFSLRDRNKRRLSKQQQTTGHDCHTTDNSVDS